MIQIKVRIFKSSQPKKRHEWTKMLKNKYLWPKTIFAKQKCSLEFIKTLYNQQKKFGPSNFPLSFSQRLWYKAVRQSNSNGRRMIQLNLGFSWIALDFPLEKHFLLCSSFAWNLCGKLNNIFRFFSADWSIFHYFCGNLSFFRDFWFINFVDNIFAIVTSLERFFNVLLIIDFFVENPELALYFYRKNGIKLYWRKGNDPYFVYFFILLFFLRNGTK